MKKNLSLIGELFWFFVDYLKCLTSRPFYWGRLYQQIIELGNQAGAGNLVIVHIRKIHINESVLDSTGKIDPTQLDLIARLGGDWYTRVTQQSLFSLKRG